MTSGLFDTKTMIKAVEAMKKPTTFLRDTFFGIKETFDTKHVEVDIVKGKRRVAPFVSPIHQGKVMEDLGFRTQEYTPALVKPKKVTNAEDLLKRLPGENSYSPNNSQDRAALKLGKDLAEMEDAITRAEELMCMQALFTGKVTQTGDGVNQQIDFGSINTVTLSGTDKWNDAVNSDPIGDIRSWRDTVMKASGVTPNVMVLAPDVVDAFINHPKLQKLLDIRKIEVGTINPQQLPNGATYIGTLNLFGLDIYSYQEWYIDETDGVEKSLIPDGKVLLCSTNAQFKILYGALTDAEDGVFVVERYPRSWVQKDPSARFVEIQSRPLPVPSIIDSILVATVI